jgi:hypothetical protein
MRFREPTLKLKKVGSAQRAEGDRRFIVFEFHFTHGPRRMGRGRLYSIPHTSQLWSSDLMNAMVSMGVRNTQLEPTRHSEQDLKSPARLDHPEGCPD